ncbi:helix-turn-helix transcriptional regulator [Chitinophaga sp. Mgbs1]|uniref:Helix-turn-helix transcriptional regulator n=1 Tax=Chitinophaga solisilvae TaxID=1233460 RepID=A0A433WJH3_9BACT|nr:helix-turn-helix transcriptional regulator [Chitinophaga solisilvae]
MTRENIYQPFEIIYKEVDSCPVVPHQHTFFELIYIVEGSGIQYVNGNSIRFETGHLFLLTPQDTHHFELDVRTRFFFLRFSQVYLNRQQTALMYTQDWRQRMEFILGNASHQPGCLLYAAADKQLVPALVDGLLKEDEGRQLYHGEVISQLVNTLITIVARNIALKLPEQVKDNTAVMALNLIRYIQEHIYSPQELRAEVVAKQFGISVSYLGRYFRKHTGENMQDYITNYKLKLVEIRLQHSDMRINEIAAELNFTDESHLNRLFKKYRGMNPSAFRKQAAVA